MILLITLETFVQDFSDYLHFANRNCVLQWIGLLDGSNL
jgi:hypothetical protein